MNEKTSTISNSMIWFGAAVSIAEILTGTLIAPLGMTKGVLAILLGHLIGCVLLFLAGLIGGKSGKSSMETVGISFGSKGAKLFSLLNVIQLVGWTAIMIVSGADAAMSAVSFASFEIWAVVIGLLIICWILAGVKSMKIINAVAMLGLFVLCCILSVIIFASNEAMSIEESITFGAAVELSVAMPLSWLPLISDYTRSAKKPFAATMASSITYFAVSSWMYIIGMGAVLFTGESSISTIMLKTGLGIAALVTVILSTVTTTFLDVYSAGVSAESISKKLKYKPFALAVAAIGVLLAIFTPISEVESFLYLIGSVFAPMIAILITDYFLLGKKEEKDGVDISNIVIWLVGFILYRICMHFETPVGYTLPVMIITAVITIIVNKFKEAKKMIEKCLENVRKNVPLVHNITNYVTVNDCANALLAIGGSPIMADDIDDVRDITAICGGLNINIGTLNSRTVASMCEAAAISNKLGHPVLLDPVGAGASKMRTETASKLVNDYKMSVIRGNISEIKALALGTNSTKGVDADVADSVNDENIDSVIAFARELSEKTDAVIVITGAIDLVVDTKSAYAVRNGNAMMSKITGTGCMLSSIMTAFIVANPNNIAEAALAAVCAMGLAGERAYDKLDGRGNATYRTLIIDELYNMTPKRLAEGAKYEMR